MNNNLYLVWYEKENKILNLIGQLTYDDIDKRLPSKKSGDYSKIMTEYGFNMESTDFEILMKTKGSSSDDHFIFITKDEYNKLKNEVK